MNNPPMRLPEEVPEDAMRELDPMNDPEAMTLAQQAVSAANEAPEDQPGVPYVPTPNLDALHVDLPVGTYNPVTRETVERAEVRELTGEDEEYFTRARNLRDRKTRLLERGVVKLGDTDADPKVLAQLTTADREVLLLGICRVTYGDGLEIPLSCPRCQAEQTALIDLGKDVTIQSADGSREEVTLPSGTKMVFRWQTGADESAIGDWVDKNSQATKAELNTKVIATVVESLDGNPMFGDESARKLGLRIRSEIVSYLFENQPGPRYNELTHTCASCGHEAPLEVVFEDLFR